MSASCEGAGRAAQWVLKSSAKCDQKWLNSGLQVKRQKASAMRVGVGRGVWCRVRCTTFGVLELLCAVSLPSSLWAVYGWV